MNHRPIFQDIFESTGQQKKAKSAFTPSSSRRLSSLASTKASVSCFTKRAEKYGQDTAENRLFAILNEKGGTPAQGAAFAKDAVTLKRLIDEGCDLSKPEPFYGGTVFHVAVEGGSKACVELLVAHASHLANRSNSYGTTPLAWALTKSGAEAAEIVAVLRKAVEGK
jgi:ankyrin repeat protein